MRTLLIGGSPAHGSHTTALLQAVSDALIAQGQEVELWDLAENRLAFSQPSWHANPLKADSEAVCEFYGSVLKADAVVLGTPLYHGSYSGVLKNALDCLTGDAFKNKPVGLVSHGSNMRKAHQPCLHLTTVVMTMQGVPTHIQIGTGKEDYAQSDVGYVVTDTSILERCNTLALELVAWVSKLAA